MKSTAALFREYERNIAHEWGIPDEMFPEDIAVLRVLEAAELAYAGTRSDTPEQETLWAVETELRAALESLRKALGDE